MKIKRILITGDDGYRAIGIRLLLHYLKNDFEIFVAATEKQQSGVGGHISMKNGGHWGDATVDGVPAFWVDGYPCDAVECIVGHVAPFDLVLSGINMGLNVGATIECSGTYSAGIHAVGLGLAPRAMMLSWNCPPEFWTYTHNGDEDVTPYLSYPGKTANAVIRKAIDNNLWNAQILNINFPTEESLNVRFTQGVTDTKNVWHYPVDRDLEKKTFSYPGKPVQTKTKGQLDIDSGAILSGFISITPHRATLIDSQVYENTKDMEFCL